MTTEHDWLGALRETSLALQAVLGAVLETERRFAPAVSPLQRLHEITTSPEWAWLQPLYRLIADIDHALAYAEDLPASEAAAIGAHARGLLSGPRKEPLSAPKDGLVPATNETLPGAGVAVERAFLDHYRSLLQADPAVAMAHARALKALQGLPSEPEDQAERLHARHQWNERRRYLRASQDGHKVS
jgi:hypothetical protein